MSTVSEKKISVINTKTFALSSIFQNVPSFHPYHYYGMWPIRLWKELFCKFIKNLDCLMSPLPERIVWCYNIWQKAYDQIEAEFIHRVPDFDYFDGKPTLLVLDDLMGQKLDMVTNFFTRGGHHLNLTVFYLVQNLFFRGIRTISLNSQIVVLLKKPRDSQQLSFIARQSFVKHTKEIETIFADATKKAHGYLLFNFCSETPDQIRIHTGIFPEDQQFVYVLT